MIYASKPLPGGLISASLDAVSRAGTVEGWALYRDRSAICHIQVRLDGAIVAGAMADQFRPDLLQAGLGYGHCAFYAHMRPLPPGTYALQLFDGYSGVLIDHGGAEKFAVPQFDSRPPHTIQSLLRPRKRWRDADLLAHHQCLDLDYNYGILGPDRFVERVFRFVLGRWADPEGGRHYTTSLRTGEATPTDVFLALLGSVERQQQTRPLPRPMDADFPFVRAAKPAAGNAPG